MNKADFLKLSDSEKRKYLSELINRKEKGTNHLTQKYPEITEVGKDRFSVFPLTETQESFWVGKMMEKGNNKVGCHIYFEIEEKCLDTDRLEEAWNLLIHHHDMLRDQMMEKGKQRILEHVNKYRIKIYDQNDSNEAKIKEHIEILRNRMSHKVYSNTDYPLYEICVTLMKEDMAVIHFSIDEWIVDATSVSILFEQWYQLYHNREYELPVLNLTFRDFVMALKKFEVSTKFKEDLEYWKNKLSHLQNYDVHIANQIDSGKVNRSGNGGTPERTRFEYALNKQIWSRIKQRAQQAEVSPTALLLYLFSKVIKEFNENKELPVILTYFNRLPFHKDIDKVVGPFITTMIYVNQENTGITEFEKGLKDVQQQLWEDNDHSNVSGVRILRELKKEKLIDTNYTIPIVFTSMINSIQRCAGEKTGTWFDQVTYSITQTPQVYLDHQIMEINGELIFHWDVQIDYFRDSMIHRMFDRYCEKLEELGKDSVVLCIAQGTNDVESASYKLTDLQRSHVYNQIINSNSDYERMMYQEFIVKGDSIERIQNRWNQMINETDVLNTVFTKKGKQIVIRQEHNNIPVIDLSLENAEQKKSRTQQLRAEMTQRSFSLYQLPRYDLRIVKLEEDCFQLNMLFDSSIVDGRSLAILYKKLFTKQENVLEERVSFGSYMTSKSQYQKSFDANNDYQYWEKRFDKLYDGPFIEYIKRSESNAKTLRISAVINEYKKLKDLAMQYGVDTENILITAYMDTLRKYSNRENFTVVCVNWDRPNTKPSIANTIGELSGLSWLEYEDSQRSFMERVVENDRLRKKDIAHQLVSGITSLRKTKEALVLPVVFTNIVKDVELELPDNITFGAGLSKTPQVYLDNVSFIHKDRLLVNWDYKDIFPEGMVERMLNDYVNQVEELCGIGLSKGRSDETSIDSQSDFQCIHEYVEMQARRYPENIALKCKDSYISYDELNQKANQLAHYLRKAGVDRDVLVGICMEKSNEMIIAILAILKAGGAYVPIDPNYPSDRIAFILEDSQAVIVITKEVVSEKILSKNNNKICIDKLNSEIEKESRENLEVKGIGTQLAYVIYTSGSTGKPKGVLITHHNVVRLFEQTKNWYHFNEKDVWAMYHSFAFDFSVWEIWGALIYGGTLIIVPYELSRSFTKMYELLEKEKVTVLNQTPTAFKQLMKVEEEEGQRNLSLRYIIFGGEALNLKSLKTWFDRHGDKNPQLVNMYGITETTVHVTYRPLRSSDAQADESLIGEAIPDLDLYILDDELREVKAGEIGEICVGGPGLARGYLNRPEITKEKFINHPHKQGERLYLSGDLGRYTDNYKDIEYIGRKDSQVKIRGFRIELGEIETVLVGHPNIKESAVVVEEGERESKILAFVVGSDIDTTQIRKYVRSKLPDYMVPNIIKQIGSIPMTINGKLDYRELIKCEKAEGPDTVTTEDSNKKDAIISRLHEILKEELEEDHVEDTEDIFNLGATSLTIVNIAKSIREELGVDIPIDIFLDTPRVGEISNYIINHYSPLVELSENKMQTEYQEKQSVVGITEDELRDIFASELETEDIDVEEDIFNLGATSLTIVSVVKQIREKKGIEVEMDVFLEHPTVRDIIKYMKANVVSAEPEEKPQIDDGKSIQLYDYAFDNSVYKKYNESSISHNRTITMIEISRLLGLLKRERIGLKSHYLYASAGGKNSVQTYVYLKENAVEQIAEGIYYYHPEEHQLYYISQGNNVTDDIFPEHYQKDFKQAGFAIFFIAQLKAIEPVYLDFSTGLVTIDSGYMQELLLNNQKACNIGLCYVEGIDFDCIKQDFLLEEGHVFINGMLGCSLSQENKEYQPKLSSGNELIKHFRTKPRYITKEEQEEKFRNMKYNQLTKKEILELAKKKLHIRTFDKDNKRITLPHVSFEPIRYLNRTSKREYNKEKISLQKLSEFLSVLRVVQSNQELQYLYPSVCDAHLVNVYIYVKDNAVEELDQGIYEYNQKTHKLNLINSYQKPEIEYCHTPFNRPHYKASGFSIYLIADLKEAKRIYGDGYLKYVMTEAGFMGQLLMDRQAACEIGLVPIGGLNFERIRQEFRLGNDFMLLHSFMGGKYDYSKIISLKTDDKKENKQDNKKIVELEDNEDAIAIVGMSGRYPKANSIMEFWENIKNARNCISNVEDSTYRLIRDRNCYGGFVDDIEKFDASFFHLSKGEAELLDPQVRLFLEAAYQAMDDAGYQIGERQDIGVFIGSMYQHYHLLNLDSEDADLMEIQSYSSIANRVSYYFNFIGPSVAIDTACSSSIVAMQMAADSICKEECSTAIVGGVNLSLHDSKYSALKKMGLVSNKDRTCCFGNGDGFIPGEGIGAFVIKKLSQAKKDKNHIYGIIKAIGINHTGRTNAYSMPSATMEEDLIRKTIRRAGIQTGDISYIESAANGTTLGDATEFSALNKVFRGLEAVPIGSVKSNVGHLEAASGMAQIAKVLLQFQYNQLVPTIYVDEINPLIDTQNSNLVIQKTLKHWNRTKVRRDNTEQELPRIALINSFAAGGSNACTIIEEYINNYQEEEENKIQQDHVFLFSADNKQNLLTYLDSMKEFLINQQEISLRDLSFSLANKIFLKYKLVILAKDRNELITKLNQVIEDTESKPGIYWSSENSGGSLYRIFKENKELKALIQQWMKQNCFHELAELWVNDIPVEWKKVAMLQMGNKIMLPNYTFHRQAFWIGKLSGDEKEAQTTKVCQLKDVEITSSTKKDIFEEPEVKGYIINDLLCEIMKMQKNELSPKMSVKDIGFNSLYAIRLINSIKERYGTEVSIRQVMSCRTIEELEREIDKCATVQ